jgi:hypothetical protein
MNTSSKLRAPLRALTALFASRSRGPDPEDERAQAAHAAAASGAAYEQQAAGRRDSDRLPTDASAGTLPDPEAHVASPHGGDPSEHSAR